VPLVGLVLAAIFWQPAWSLGALLVTFSLSAPVGKLLIYLPTTRARERRAAAAAARLPSPGSPAPPP